MKNAANKVWTKVKNINVTITGKIKLGFIEIAVAPLNTSGSTEPVFIFGILPVVLQAWKR